MWWWYAFPAIAGGWSGAAAESVDVIGAPTFVRRVVEGQPASGWRADLPGEDGAFVALWVAPDGPVAEALVRAIASDTGLLDRPVAAGLGAGADAVFGDGGRRVVLRDANVVIQVERPGGGADDLTDAVRAALIEGPAAVAPPVPVLADGVLSVPDGWAMVRFQALPVLDPLTLRPREVRLIPVSPSAVRVAGARHVDVFVWDALGRCATVPVEIGQKP
jgi:hypothetical protein